MRGEAKMSRDASRPQNSVDGSPTSNSSVPWKITIGGDDYPVQLGADPQHTEWRSIYGIGNRDLLKRKCLGLVCSVQCPGSVVIKTFDAIRELRDHGLIVAGGFHSPMEQDCLEFLLRGKQPVIYCPAKYPSANRLPTPWKDALDSGRLLQVSPFGEDVRRTTSALAQTRNEFVAALSTAVLIPHASPAGKAESTAQKIVKKGQPLYTFDCNQAGQSLLPGAVPFDLQLVLNLCSQSLSS